MDSVERQQVTPTEQMVHKEDSFASMPAVLSPEASGHPLLQLQQTIGNRAVQRLARLGAFQPQPGTTGTAAPARSPAGSSPGAVGQALLMAAVQQTLSQGRPPGTARPTSATSLPVATPIPTPAMTLGATMARPAPQPEPPSPSASPVAPVTAPAPSAPEAMRLTLGLLAPLPRVAAPALPAPEMRRAPAPPEAVVAPAVPPKTAGQAVPAPTPALTPTEAIAPVPTTATRAAPAPAAPAPPPVVMARRAPAAPPPTTTQAAPAPAALAPPPVVMARTVPAAPPPVPLPAVVAAPAPPGAPTAAATPTPSLPRPETAAPAPPMATVAVPPGTQPSIEAATSLGATQTLVVAPPVGESAKPAESPPTTISVKATPTSSKEDPEFQQAMTQLRYTKNVQKQHPKPAVKQQEVQNAARLPEEAQKETNDRKAHLETIGQIASQEKGAKKFQAETFKTLLNKELAELEKHLPQSEAAAAQFKKDKPLEQTRERISGQVNEENQKVAAPIAAQTMLQRPPDSGIVPQTPGPLQKDAVGSHPTPINPAAAAPKPKQDSEISLEEESRSLDELMAENKLSDEQLANSNEPDFIRALDSKKTAQTVAAAVPAQYRAQETVTLTKAQTDVRVSAQRSMESMFGKRDQTFGAVFGQQTSTQEADVSAQDGVQRELKRIYEDTKTKVNEIFTNLTTNEASPSNVIKIFNDKSTTAKGEFEKRVEDQLDDIHGLGIQDFLFGEDVEAIEAVFAREKEKFLAAMDRILDEIAGIIADQLNAAVVRIQQGLAEAERFFSSLSTEQQQLAQDAMDMFRTQYRDLEASVDDKQTELVSSLAESYKQNVDSLRETFDKLEEEARKNFIEKAAEFVVGVAKAVYNLGKLLLSIVARIAGMIDDILAHPIRFLENLAAGIKQGFETFIGNFDSYLLKGFFDWLRGSVGSMGITLPAQFDEKGLFGLALQIIGLDTQTFKEVVMRKLGAGGEKIVAVLEKGEELLGEATELFRILKTEGIGGLWTHLKEMILSHLSEIFDRVKETVLYETIKKALIFIASMFTPVGAFIKAVQALYAGLKFLMDNIERIAMLVNSFLDSLELAVKGDTGGIANKIITALSAFIVLAIDFLAKLLNLGNLADKVRKVIQALKAPVIRAMEWLVDKFIKPALDVAQKAGKAVLQAGVPQEPDERLRLGLHAATTAVNALRGPVVTAALINPVLTVIKARYGFKTLQPVERDGIWWVEGEINPKGSARTQKQVSARGQTDPTAEEKSAAKAAEREAKAQSLEVGEFVRILWTVRPIGKVTAIEKDSAGKKARFTWENVKKDQATKGGTASFDDYGKTWRFGHPNELDIEEEKLKEYNQYPKDKPWPTRDIARRVLNYRYHQNPKIQTNPSGKEWEHIHEQSRGGEHSAVNLALTDAEFNRDLGVYFGRKYSPREFGMAGTAGQALRDFLKGQPDSMHQMWKQRFYDRYHYKLHAVTNAIGFYQVLEK